MCGAKDHGDYGQAAGAVTRNDITRSSSISRKSLRVRGTAGGIAKGDVRSTRLWRAFENIELRGGLDHVERDEIREILPPATEKVINKR
jgi:hypothetical protein